MAPLSIFQRITTLHGTNHLKGRTTFPWCILMMANLLFTMSYLIAISHRYHSDQIVTRIDANCKVGQVPFPAVSICNFNAVSLRETTNIFKILSSYNRSQHEISQFFAGLPALRSFTLRQDVASLTDMLNILKRHYYSVDTIMEEVHQPCERLLLYCSFNRKRKRCVDVFSLIKTYEGHCCTFNYAALNDDRDFLLTDNSDIEFYVDPSTDYEQTNIISTSQSGRSFYRTPTTTPRPPSCTSTRCPASPSTSRWSRGSFSVTTKSDECRPLSAAAGSMMRCCWSIPTGTVSRRATRSVRCSSTSILAAAYPISTPALTVLATAAYARRHASWSVVTRSTPSPATSCRSSPTSTLEMSRPTGALGSCRRCRCISPSPPATATSRRSSLTSIISSRHTAECSP